MKSVLKVTIALIILIGMVFSTNVCYAVGIIDNPEIYKPNEPDIGVNELTSRAGFIIGVIRTVGMVASVITLMFIGIKTMTGSMEQKSHYKEALPGYLLGAFLVFAITFLPSLIYDIVNGQ